MVGPTKCSLSVLVRQEKEYRGMHKKVFDSAVKAVKGAGLKVTHPADGNYPADCKNPHIEALTDRDTHVEVRNDGVPGQLGIWVTPVEKKGVRLSPSERTNAMHEVHIDRLLEFAKKVAKGEIAA